MPSCPIPIHCRRTHRGFTESSYFHDAHRYLGRLLDFNTPQFIAPQKGKRTEFRCETCFASDYILSVAAEKTEKILAKEQAGVIFRALKETSYRQTDRMFAWLIAFEWLAAMAAASLIAPRVLPTNQPLQLVV